LLDHLKREKYGGLGSEGAGGKQSLGGLMVWQEGGKVSSQNGRKKVNFWNTLEKGLRRKNKKD